MPDPTPRSRPTRRDRRRQETLADIKAAALRQLADQGPAGISVRAIARELDMTATAVHYYYPSRSALVDALVVDGFQALAHQLRSAYDSTADLTPNERWVVVAGVHRAWALRHADQYLLIYGRTGGGARRINPEAARAMWDVVSTLFALIRDCAVHGDLDVPRLEAATPPALRAQFAAWRAAAAGIDDLSVGALAACMLSYSRLHGAIILELVGHVPPELTDRDALFDLQMRHTAEALHRPHAPL